MADLSGLSPRFAETRFHPFWQETVTDPLHLPLLNGPQSCDLAIVGAGFTGLWSALKARERHPDARIIVLEGRRLAEAASGRNGGFCAPSISHGVGNALARWPDEAETLVRLGLDNLDALERDLSRYGIAAEFERTGKINLAATPWQAEGLAQMRAAHARFGIDSRLMTGPELAAKLLSPVYPHGLYEENYAYVNPARLVHGLARACLNAGVEIYENSRVTALRDSGEALRLTTPGGEVTAGRVALATNADMPLLRRLRRTVVPIYDYTIMTEPLSDAQLAAIGWTGRHGVADSGNQFHYSRKTADNRILWGGYDAIHYFGSKRAAHLLNRAESYTRLETNFLAAFPALDGVRFSHAWGGIIDTSARLTFFVGTAFDGRLAYALGFTGQGVSASRFAALTMLDHLDGLDSERTALRMSHRLPVPFPPEPLRSAAIGWAQADLAKEDRTGRRSAMLRVMDRLGIGFGS
ncbi:NAD(P)/FAD-dependent oxidoreductase [Pseudooceanicola sp. C21-150M6]|uniref:NAD(P)/FAD-dependent oxidoreductase n=1 Tax=Pseudooceanicola sp. C21-150M6 TaxID=3434355 RepID=UPI003D7F7296